MGQGEVGRLQHWAQVAWLPLGFAVLKLLVGTEWAISLLPCTNGLTNGLLAMQGLHFWQ